MICYYYNFCLLTKSVVIVNDISSDVLDVEEDSLDVVVDDGGDSDKNCLR